MKIQSNSNCLLECKMIQKHYRQLGFFPQKKKLFSTWSSIHATIRPSDLKTHPHKNCACECLQQLYSSSPKNGKQWHHLYLSIGEWINKLWPIYSVEYYLVIKRNNLSSYAKTYSSMHITEGKKPVHKGYILLAFQFYDILEKAKL